MLLPRIDADLAEAAGDLAEAATIAERLVRADPLAEAASRRLMRLCVARGERARALLDPRVRYGA